MGHICFYLFIYFYFALRHRPLSLPQSPPLVALHDYSPIRTVIVSQGDASDFHHIQGVVGDLIAVRIQDVGVFLPPPP